MAVDPFEKLVAEVAAAYLSRNETPVERIHEVIAAIRKSLRADGADGETSTDTPTNPTSEEQATSPASAPGEDSVEAEVAAAVQSSTLARFKGDPYASIGEDHITCLVCGKRMKATLKRHLRSDHGLHEHEYRMRFGIDEKTPLVSKNYSDTRKRIAEKMHQRDKA